MKRKIVLLTIAVVIAALGATLVAVYVNGLSGKAEAKEDLVKVLTATSVINQGEPATQAQAEGKFALTQVPRSNVVSGALTSIDSMGDQVALAPIYPGEQILAAKFGTSAAAHKTLTVPKNKIAISVELTDPGRVAGFVTPGSHVAIFVTFTGGIATCGPACVGPGADENVSDLMADAPLTRVLIPDVVVLGVGPTTVTTTDDSDKNPEEVPTTVLTVGLSQHDADRVVASSIYHTLSFGLLGRISELPSDPGITAQDLLK